MADTELSTAPPTEGQQARRVLNAAVNVSEALAFIAGTPRGVTAKALAHRLGNSLSSTYYTLQTLTSLGLVEPSPCAAGLHTLGPRIAELYRSYVENHTMPERLAPILTDLRSACAAKSYLGAWSQGDLEITHAVGRRGATELQDVSAGFRGAAHALSIGKVLLSHTRPQHWPSYLRGERYELFTDKTIPTPGLLHIELANARKAGWAWDNEEFRERVACLSCPVRDSAGRVIAAIAVSVTPARFERERDDLLVEVRRAADAASAMFAGLDPLSAMLRRAADM
jgi:DNA-binding IclR family transcriptional regulator